MISDIFSRQLVNENATIKICSSQYCASKFIQFKLLPGIFIQKSELFGRIKKLFIQITLNEKRSYLKCLPGESRHPAAKSERVKQKDRTEWSGQGVRRD